ncbi:PTB domain-containing engulfment adapter protein 1-like isoform X2 [Mya arenaria]|uniref:PTB domain-containing engulfment adapter protein 1-like isoform X2 n=1 Tax=Mya arenaria TaxID=6604 RepID=UPI0022E7CBCE|nr:PTB domain-containing engulfment adapter protein 1-like isoform X2 [Mya arenaria]
MSNRQNTVLIPSEEFGLRKFINVGINRSLSLSRIEELSKNHYEDMRSGNKQWIHPPDALTKGHILYNVKFYGESEVDSPKGTDVVKDAIRKRKFNKTLRKTEGQKTPKVELSISVDGVSIQEPKTKIVKHSYPLHRISYCADDKSDKRMFTFIAKSPETSKHNCYVFASERNAEEITLTIGQAFDLAYRKFLDTQGKDADVKKQQQSLQKRVDQLEKENTQLKQRIRDLEHMKDRPDIEQYKQTHQISSLVDISSNVNGESSVFTFQNNMGETSTDSPNASQPSSPKLTTVGRKLENLMFEPDPFTSGGGVSNGHTSPRTPGTPGTPGIISPPPPSTRSRNKPGTPATPVTPQQAPPPPSGVTPQGSQSNDLDELASVFMSSNMSNVSSPSAVQNNYNNNYVNPFSSPSMASKDPMDPFGMASFTPQGTLQQSNSIEYNDIQAGFSQGLSFGTEDFGMNAFDPFNTSGTN